MTRRSRPDHRKLFEVASEQAGHFSAAQARRCGFSWALLAHHAAAGRFERVRTGLYRLRAYPRSAREEVLAAWLAAGKETAVVSHESALELLGLCDVVPSSIHLTVPRSRRYRSVPRGVTLHTTSLPLRSSDTVVRDGLRLTSPARSIADAAGRGLAPEQVALAAREALRRGLVVRSRLLAAARARGRRVARLVESAIADRGARGAGSPPDPPLSPGGLGRPVPQDRHRGRPRARPPRWSRRGGRPPRPGFRRHGRGTMEPGEREVERRGLGRSPRPETGREP
ncbi:MAG TPA: type IV toxin-antitoxin system AbiEi family antitoxin domain-containing protein [Planctomycetota bacterium]|jgi:predicted transcriptional regulator of viral defense system|nr:type IV toxin-antitoxin system AbiEi family antitoxin domain-containing protein [Planctomycetota bacterium]